MKIHVVQYRMFKAYKISCYLKQETSCMFACHMHRIFYNMPLNRGYLNILAIENPKGGSYAIFRFKLGHIIIYKKHCSCPPDAQKINK